jgi:hypothetical protein
MCTRVSEPRIDVLILVNGAPANYTTKARTLPDLNRNVGRYVPGEAVLIQDAQRQALAAGKSCAMCRSSESALVR